MNSISDDHPPRPLPYAYAYGSLCLCLWLPSGVVIALHDLCLLPMPMAPYASLSPAQGADVEPTLCYGANPEPHAHLCY